MTAPDDARRMWLTLLAGCGAAALLGVGAVTLAGNGQPDVGTSPLFPAVARGIEGLNEGSFVLLAGAGFIVALLGPAHPLLVGLSTMALFPLISIADMVVDPTSHNLFPFEWAMYALLTLPGVAGAFAGRRFKRSLADRQS